VRADNTEQVNNTADNLANFNRSFKLSRNRKCFQRIYTCFIVERSDVQVPSMLAYLLGNVITQYLCISSVFVLTTGKYNATVLINS
jgi:hypothetical protein